MCSMEAPAADTSCDWLVRNRLTTHSFHAMLLKRCRSTSVKPVAAWFGRARRAEHAKACSHARPTKQNRRFSLVILKSKFDGAGVQARIRVLCTPRAIKPGCGAPRGCSLATRPLPRRNIGGPGRRVFDVSRFQLLALAAWSPWAYALGRSAWSWRPACTGIGRPCAACCLANRVAFISAASLRAYGPHHRHRPRGLPRRVAWRSLPAAIAE